MKDTTAAGASAGKVIPSGHQVAEPVAAPEADEADVRARPGRRTVEERQQAVLDLLAGKATVDQIARRLGVQPATVEGWREDAMGGIAEALRRGSGKTPGELELERKHRDLERVVTQLSIQKCLLEQALEIEREKRPTPPARSRR
jgi:transposase-like protein